MLDITFNSHFLTEALGVVPASWIAFSLNIASRPGMIRGTMDAGTDDPSFLCVLMPMQLMKLGDRTGHGGNRRESACGTDRPVRRGAEHGRRPGIRFRCRSGREVGYQHSARRALTGDRFGWILDLFPVSRPGRR